MGCLLGYVNLVLARCFEFQTTSYLFPEGRLKVQNACHPIPLPRAWLVPHTLRSEFPLVGCVNLVHARRFGFQTTLYLFLEGRLKIQNACRPIPLPRAWLAPNTLRSEFPPVGCMNLVHARRFGFQTTLYLFLEGRLKVQNACRPIPLPRAWLAPHTLRSEFLPVGCVNLVHARRLYFGKTRVDHFQSTQPLGGTTFPHRPRLPLQSDTAQTLLPNPAHSALPPVRRAYPQPARGLCA